ncbi:hypothetical protein BST61_g1895 [Cercospora zeina]
MESSPLMPQDAENDAISPITPQQAMSNDKTQAHLSSKHMTTKSLRSISDNVSTLEDHSKNPLESSRKLRRFSLTLWLTVTYAILSIVAWTITCTLVHEPLNASHYGLYLKDGDVYANEYPARSMYTLNERILQVARVVQAIVAVSTVPLTSATPTSLARLEKITDLLDRFDDDDPTYNILGPAQLRSALISTTSTDPQIRLWTSGGALNCTGSLGNNNTAYCERRANSFFANYSTVVRYGTRSRQDISEQLYLNLSACSPSPDRNGYFELPNIMNGQLPGRLLDDDPTLHCGRDCILQGDSPGEPIYDQNNTLRRRDEVQESNGTYKIDDQSFALSTVKKKGPLLTIAMALFGQSSWIADRAQHPEIYVNKNVTATSASCTERVPFAGLLTSMDDDYSNDATDYNSMVRCVSNNAWHFGHLQDDLRIYVQMFIGPETRDDNRGPSYETKLENAFEAAAFLANERWLTAPSRATLTVKYDAGAPLQVPHISRAGMIFISVLLSIYLVSLLAMALGAAIAEHLPFQLANDTHKVRIPDEIPGWIGDGGEHPEDDTTVGEIGLGASGALRLTKRYKCYPARYDASGQRLKFGSGTANDSPITTPSTLECATNRATIFLRVYLETFVMSTTQRSNKSTTINPPSQTIKASQAISHLRKSSLSKTPMFKSLVIASLTLASTVLGRPAAPSPSAGSVKPNTSTANFSGPYTQASNHTFVAATATACPTPVSRHGGLIRHNLRDDLPEDVSDMLSIIEETLQDNEGATSPVPILDEQVKFLQETKKFAQELAWAKDLSKYLNMTDMGAEVEKWV